jgi:biopolymer transport protein ExbD/biopolymer transport protein TolR
MARRKRSSEDDDLDITPMIDVTFLLLIFFMVTSTMKPEGALQIPSAKNGLGVDAKDACILSVFDDDGTPGVYLADGKRENGPVPTEQVTRYVQDEKKRYVIIKSDRKVPSGFVEEVARAAAEAEGGEDLEFFIAVQDKPR